MSRADLEACQVYTKKYITAVVPQRKMSSGDLLHLELSVSTTELKSHSLRFCPPKYHRFFLQLKKAVVCFLAHKQHNRKGLIWFLVPSKLKQPVTNSWHLYYEINKLHLSHCS